MHRRFRRANLGREPVQVADVMTRDVEFVEASTTIAEAAVAMGDLGVGALPVGTADDLQGIITDRDILFRVVAKGLGNKSVTVGEVSCAEVKSSRVLAPVPPTTINGGTVQ